MESDPNPDGSYSREYLQQVCQSLLRKGNNISLAELNTSNAAEHFSEPTVASESQIRETVKIIQSNGAPKAETSTGKMSGKGHGKSGVSLLVKRGRGESSIMGYKKKQQRRAQSDPYYFRWRNLKKYVKNMVFMNAALCDEVLRQEEKVAKAREERRFLLRKLLQQQSISEITPIPRPIPASIMKSPVDDLAAAVNKTKSKKKSAGGIGAEKAARQTKEMLESLGVKNKRPKCKKGGGKHVVPPIPLDAIGRPIFPLTMGDLTLHSIGEIVPYRPGFHTSNSIFPVGYCSTRVYSSLHSPDKQCLYTCKISDGGNGPMFEIVPDDDSKIFKSRFLSECHSQLLRALNQARGGKVVETVGKGPEFFGLAHPLVQNLIQSCPGAKKCNGYKWIKFEVNKSLTIERMPSLSDDPSISHPAMKRRLSTLQDPTQPNLRTLLTGSALDQTKVSTDTF